MSRKKLAPAARKQQARRKRGKYEFLPQDFPNVTRGYPPMKPPNENLRECPQKKILGYSTLPNRYYFGKNECVNMCFRGCFRSPKTRRRRAIFLPLFVNFYHFFFKKTFLPLFYLPLFFRDPRFRGFLRMGSCWVLKTANNTGRSPVCHCEPKRVKLTKNTKKNDKFE